MRTIGAKDKVLKRNFNRKKSYIVTMPDGSEVMTQALNRFELRQQIPNLTKYVQLQGYDD